MLPAFFPGAPLLSDAIEHKFLNEKEKAENKTYGTKIRKT
jgi:hypothetical protein